MIVNRAGLAEAMGISDTTLDRWVREGCPIKSRGSRGRSHEFSVSDVIAWWGAREREKAAANDTSSERELKRRRLAAETGKAELDFVRAKEEVGLIADFERAAAKLMASVRVNILNVPARAVLQLLGETDEAAFKRILRAELVLALEQAAQADIDLDDDAEESDEAA